MHTGITPAIVVHMFAAFAALGPGSCIFLRRKGDPAHRDSGRVTLKLRQRDETLSVSRVFADQFKAM